MSDPETQPEKTYRIHDDPVIETTDQAAAAAARALEYRVETVSNDDE